VAPSGSFISCPINQLRERESWREREREMGDEKMQCDIV
jgi:hypothetical protein